jgi:hypothetical protein
VRETTNTSCARGAGDQPRPTNLGPKHGRAGQKEEEKGGQWGKVRTLVGGLEGAVDGLQLACGEARQERRLQRSHARHHVVARGRRGRLRLLLRWRRRLRRRRRRRFCHGRGRWRSPREILEYSDLVQPVCFKTRYRPFVRGWTAATIVRHLQQPDPNGRKTICCDWVADPSPLRA